MSSRAAVLIQKTLKVFYSTGEDLKHVKTLMLDGKLKEPTWGSVSEALGDEEGHSECEAQHGWPQRHIVLKSLTNNGEEHIVSMFYLLKGNGHLEMNATNAS